MTPEQSIGEQTGFDLGDEFETAEQVWTYFNAEVQRGMFGEDAISDQEVLDAMAEQVIEHGWHMVKPDDAVEVAVISNVLDRAGVSARCLDTLRRAGIQAVWQTRGEGMVAVRLSVRPDDYQRAIDALEVGVPERFTTA